MRVVNPAAAPGWAGMKLGVLANALRTEMHGLIDKLDPLGKPEGENALVRLQLLAALEQFPGVTPQTEKDSANA